MIILMATMTQMVFLCLQGRFYLKISKKLHKQKEEEEEGEEEEER